MMFLIDTSVWIEVFRRGSRLRLETICQPEQIVLVLPVYQEVLQGIRDEKFFRKAREALINAKFVENPLGSETFDEAVNLYRLARSRGVTVRSSVDCLIAACAIRHNLRVVHRDRDFGALAKLSALDECRV